MVTCRCYRLSVRYTDKATAERLMDGKAGYGFTDPPYEFWIQIIQAWRLLKGNTGGNKYTKFWIMKAQLINNFIIRYWERTIWEKLFYDYLNKNEAVGLL